MKKLLGKPVSLSIYEEIASKKASSIGRNKNFDPCLVTVRIGDDEASIAYEKRITKACNEHGIKVKNHVFDPFVKIGEVEDFIQEVNNNRKIHGCLLFQPVTRDDILQEFKLSLDLRKDIDGITYESMSYLYAEGMETEKIRYFAPCTARACMELLKYYDIDVSGKHVAILGRSEVVGKPLSLLMLSENATVTVLHSKSVKKERICRDADILVSAMGRAGAVGETYTNEDQIILDVGINFEDGQLCGDVKKEVLEKVKAGTPVPGGIGAVTTAILLRNLISSWYLTED